MKSYLRRTKASGSTIQRVEKAIRNGWKPSGDGQLPGPSFYKERAGRKGEK
jgi:hypothetical protein